jgi:uncharacterized protein YcfJ
MKRLLGALAALLVAAPAFAGDVGVSVRVGEPGFYGSIDVGGLPPPRLVYTEPMIVTPAPYGAVAPDPIYLRVPPGHARNWRRYCARYDACGRPVYFVTDRWYNEVYAPRYRGGYAVAEAAPAYVAPPPPAARLYSVPVASVRAIVGPPEQRCWVERQQVVENRGDVNVPGAIAGAVIGGVLGHQIGAGHGRDIATIGGAVAGGAIGANVGRDGGQVVTRDVQRCRTVQRDARPAYWEVTYHFRGRTHYAQFATPPGSTIVVDERGEPRG